MSVIEPRISRIGILVAQEVSQDLQSLLNAEKLASLADRLTEPGTTEDDVIGFTRCLLEEARLEWCC